MSADPAEIRREAAPPVLFDAFLPAHALSPGPMQTRRARLTVRPAELTLVLRGSHLFGSAAAVIRTQTKADVKVNVARLPPWYDTVIFVESEDGEAFAGMPRWQRLRLLRALGTAGFNPVLRRRSIFMLWSR